MALTKPFAQNGDKKAIPQSTSDGSVSFDRGFGSFYALPPEEGGLFIDRAQFNQLMYDTTSAVISNQNSINTLNSKVANIESNVSTGVVNLTGNQTIAGTKTFSSPVVVPNAKANTHAVNLAQLNTKANQATTYTKTEVDTRVNAKIDSSKATKILTENLVKTVGASGADFANLRQALEWASQYSYSNQYTITLNCNADMPIPGTYLPFGEAEIIIDGQNNSYNCHGNYFMAAVRNYSGNIKIKNFILNFNNINSTAYGAAFQFSSANYKLENVTININNSSISSLIVSQHGLLQIKNLTINFIGNTTISSIIRGAYSSVLCGEANNFNIDVSQLTGSIKTLFNLRSGQSDLYGTSPYPTDKINSQISITQGAIVTIGSNFTDSKLSSAPNTITSRGIIFKQ